MTPTLYAATLANPRASGTALTDGTPHRGAPIAFVLCTSREVAERRLVEAARIEWDDPDDGLRLGLGPASEWVDERLLATMREHGYLAAVTEQAVEL